MRILWCLAALSVLASRLPAQEGLSSLAVDPTKVPADATVILKGGLLSAGVGYEWGRGIVMYQGKQREFCIRGLAVGDVGIADIEARGVVFHLNSLKELPGRYSSVSLGVALIKGESTAPLKNEQGVTLQLQSRVTGVRFNIAAAGVRIRMAGSKGCPRAADPAPQ